jgi:aminopeptidase
VDTNTFKTYRQRYADLLVRFGLNVQPGQVVNISTEVIHAELAYEVLEACYKVGAKYVGLDLGHPKSLRARILGSKADDLSYVPPYISTKYKDLVDDSACNLKIIGSEYPEILSDLDTQKINVVRLNQHMAIKYFYDEGIGKSKVQWTVAAASTPGWGKRLFPELKSDHAEELLWEHIFKICRVDREDYLEAWQTHDKKLHARAELLNEMQIETAYFTGPGTDFEVSLSKSSLWKGGSDEGPKGASFEPNVPTEEVFTTPDARRTRGNVTTTRPFLVNGKLIKGLKLEFDNGEIKSLSAEEGEESYKEYISSDPGAKRLGELALVGINSPVYQSGIVFEEILFDENAACHIAVGSAYKFCVKDGTTMSKEQLAEIGCNESTVHTDMMISNEKVTVEAKCFDGTRKVLIKDGAWVV